MNRDAMQKMRLDRRLIRRRGWVSETELARELAALPDAASKAITLGEAIDERESGGAAAHSPGEPGTGQ